MTGATACQAIVDRVDQYFDRELRAGERATVGRIDRTGVKWIFAA